MFEDIIGSEEKFYDDTIEFEYYGETVTEDTKGPKVLDLNDFIDEKDLNDAIDKIIDEALRELDKNEDCCDEEGCDCSPATTK